MYLTGSDTPSSLSVTNSQTKKLIMPTVNSLLKMDSLMPPTWKASWSPRRRKEKNKLLLFFNFKILLPFFIFRQNTIETNLKKMCRKHPLTQKQLYYHVTSSEQLATKVASYFFEKPLKEVVCWPLHLRQHK